MLETVLTTEFAGYALGMIAVPILVLIAAYTDLQSRRIPNWVNLSIFLLFFPTAWLAGLGWLDLGIHFLGLVVLLIIGFLLMLTGKFGAGDAKMIAAVGLWFGGYDVIVFLAYTAIMGGLLAIIMKIWDMVRISGAVHITGNGVVSLSGLEKIFLKKLDLPYGVAISAGTLWALPENDMLQSFLFAMF